jgi:hypothetical protein
MSIITLKYFFRQASLIEIAKVKAEYEVENSIAKININTNPVSPSPGL